LRQQVTGALSHLELRMMPPPTSTNSMAGIETRHDPALDEPKGGVGLLSRTRSDNTIIDPEDQSTWGRIQRNEPCPCGSGRKYKYCHGKME